MSDRDPHKSCSSYEPGVIRHKLIVCFGHVIKNLSNTSNIADTLISRKIISFDDAERVRTEKTEESRARELLAILDKKPDEALCVFLEALVEDNDHVLHMILDAQEDNKPHPVSKTLSEHETLVVFLDACLSHCLRPDPVGCMDVSMLTQYMNHQCTNSGLPHLVTDDDVIEAVERKFKTTINKSQSPEDQAPTQLLGVSWSTAIQDKLQQKMASHSVVTGAFIFEADVDTDILSTLFSTDTLLSQFSQLSVTAAPPFFPTEPFEQPHVESATIQLLSEQLHELIKHDTTRAVTYLEKMSQLDRTRVVSHPVNNKTALYKAFYVNAYNLMVYIIEECGASVNQCVVPMKHVDKTTILAQAAYSNKLQVATLLVTHGADVNKANEEGTLTFLVKDADGDTAGMTPIMLASQQGHLDMVKYLLQVGADVNLADMSGRTCLMAAIKSDDVTKYLMSLGGEVNAQDKNGDTALHRAAQHGCMRSIQLLMDHRAEVNTRNSAGDTALHVAIETDSLDMIDLLLGNGADPYIRNKKKEDALLLAVLSGNSKITDILILLHKANGPS